MTVSKRAASKLSIIPAAEIADHIGRVASSRKEQERHMHQVAISCFFIAAKDGQISPLNRFNIVISPASQVALKAYALQHCRQWLTMEKGEYRVRPNSDDGRHDFQQIAAKLVAAHSFLERDPGGADTPPTPAKPLDETRVLKAVRRLVKQVRAAIEAGNPGLTADFANILEHFEQRLARLVDIHSKPVRGRGRPRKIIELEHARGQRDGAPQNGMRKPAHDLQRPAAH